MAEKSAFRDLCSVICIFLPPLILLLLGFCFSGFCQLPLLVSKTGWTNCDFGAFQRDVAGQGMSAVSRANSTEAAPSPCALINHFWGENTFSWTKPRCGGSVSITVGRRVKVSVCPRVAISTKGRSESGSRCADCEVFVQLSNGGMCSMVEEKCGKPNFLPKLLFFQTLSGELPEKVCKRLWDAISFKIAQGFAQSSKLSNAFPLLLVFLFFKKKKVFIFLHYCMISAFPEVVTCSRFQSLVLMSISSVDGEVGA